ncbi:hypothetical protein KSF_106300 [Reticulibacter mediterranei]|uniref:NADAR domain-containing protein n=1 Tax=Reticulibacter mediterranei TaxID=2778369 RepID=A0A8J3N6P9_9CHLR|nr:NADAR family protein [Reticulibacter mediterranei]GHP00583.1 hypothetical protein KSF_106300 [Reticulibacter mediterranei]
MSSRAEAIFFYKVEGLYGCFSNFSSHSIVMKSRWWPTTAHYFQAQKFAGTAYAEQIRLAPTPQIATEIGRDPRLPLRRDWEQVKDDVMREAVLHKFATYEDLAKVLLATGEKQIIENNRLDPYWGCGPDGNGKNRLGHILVEVRTILRERVCSSRVIAVY